MPPAGGIAWPRVGTTAGLSAPGRRDAAQEQTGLVERLESCISRQDLDLDEEQRLLESLLKTSDGAGPEGALSAVLPLDAHGWSRLVTYAFERRYGWSESADVNDDRAMDSLDNRAKKKINDALDQVTLSPALMILTRHMP